MNFSEGPSDELQEVEEELVSKKGDGNEKDDDADDIETGRIEKKSSFWCLSGIDNAKVFTQAFTLTFLAEWGDRSQIATIGIYRYEISLFINNFLFSISCIKELLRCNYGWASWACPLHWNGCNWWPYARS